MNTFTTKVFIKSRNNIQNTFGCVICNVYEAIYNIIFIYENIQIFKVGGILSCFYNRGF